MSPVLKRTRIICDDDTAEYMNSSDVEEASGSGINDGTLGSVTVQTLTFANFTIQMRHDGYVNATKMCLHGNSSWASYRKNQGSTAYAEAVARSLKIVQDRLITYQHDGQYEERGTYVHPHIAIHLAQWIDPDFAVAVTSLVQRYATGQITTEDSQRAAHNLLQRIKPVEASESTDDQNQDCTQESSQPTEIGLLRKELEYQRECADLKEQLCAAQLDQQRAQAQLELQILKNETNLNKQQLEKQHHQRQLEKQHLQGQLDIQQLKGKLDNASCIAMLAKQDLVHGHRTQINEIKSKAKVADIENRRMVSDARHRESFTRQKLDFLTALWHLREREHAAKQHA